MNTIHFYISKVYWSYLNLTSLSPRRSSGIQTVKYESDSHNFQQTLAVEVEVESSRCSKHNAHRSSDTGEVAERLNALVLKTSKG